MWYSSKKRTYIPSSIIELPKWCTFTNCINQATRHHFQVNGDRSIATSIFIKDTAHRQTNRIQPEIIANISELDCYANQNSTNYNLHKKEEVFICSILLPKVYIILHLKDCYTSNRYFALLYTLCSLNVELKRIFPFEYLTKDTTVLNAEHFLLKREEKMGIERK